MATITANKSGSISKNLLVLLAMLMAFAALVLFIFLWYNVQIKTIDKRIELLPQTEGIQIQNYKPHILIAPQTKNKT